MAVLSLPDTRDTMSLPYQALAWDAETPDDLDHLRGLRLGLHLDAGGTGGLPLTLLGPDRIAFLHLWPHARPWRLGKPEPMLRSVPQAALVARVLTEAWSQATGVAASAAAAPASPAQPANDRTQGHGQQPALARG